MANRLTDERLKALYDEFNSVPRFGDWRERYLAELEWVESLGAEEFRTPQAQERLWKLPGLSRLGPGESVDVKGAYTDEKVIDALVELRSTTLPPSVKERAAFLQSAYDRVLGLVHPKHSKFRPQAKIARLLTGLFPRETTTLYSYASARNVNALLLEGRAGGALEAMVRVRARLRDALGPEKDLAEDVERAMFCWWLATEYDAETGGGSFERAADEPVVEDVAKLELWSMQKARKGLVAVGGYLEAWRAVVNAAEHGATADDIVVTLGQVFASGEINKLNAASRRMLFNEVRGCGFLKNENGLWFPSDDGLVLVEQDPPDILVERFLVQAFGVAQTLRFLKTGPRTRRDLYDELRRQYPAWTVDFGPSALAAWARALGLIEPTGKGMYALTDYGRYWENRLPDELPTGEALAIDDEEVDGDSVLEETGEFEPRRFGEILERIRANHPDFVIDESQLRNLHVAWDSQSNKRFVILSGLSGTGKTAILRHYAEAYLELCGLPAKKHLAVVAVSPDWRDPTSLLGYFNALQAEPTWQRERALTLLLDASANPDKPYFLVLDEMNLAPVEHYFAPFLSAMETGLPLALHEEDEPVNGVPPKIAWPKNLFIAGTVNMDETTQSISDKVLDRAFTLEFWDVDLERFLEERGADPDHVSLLLDLHGILAKARRHFGYRTAGEVLGYIRHEDATPELLDHAVVAKVLPRIRGEESPVLVEAIEKARARCAASKLVRSEAKLGEMLDRLKATGVTRFWS